jgi:hypothetical protein
MSFAQGLQAGALVAKGWLEAYDSADEKRRKDAAQAEISKIGKAEPMPEMAPNYSVESSTVGLAPQQSIMRQPQSEALGSGNYNMGDDYTSVPGMRTGLQAGRAPAAPAPVGAGYARGYTPEQIDNARGTGLPMPMSARTAQEADIYARFGLSDQATRSRERAYDVGRQEVADANTAEANQRLTDEYNYKLKQRQGNENAIKSLSSVLATGEQIDLPSIYKIANEHGADPQAMTAFVGDSLGITDKIAVAKVNKMARDVQAAATDPKTLQAYIEKNSDPDPNDGITPKLTQVKGGWVIMYGDKPLQGTQMYPDSKDMPGFTALAYDMVEKAKGNPLGWAVQKQTMEKNAAAINASNAQVRASDAQASLAGPHGEVLRAQADYYKNKGNADKMGGTQYFNGQDGNMYASTPVFSPTGGLTFQTTKVNPDAVKFQKPGVEGAGTKPVDVKEEGTKVTIGGQLRVADGLGNYIDPKGILPSARSKVLTEANIPDNLAAELPWAKDGTAVGFGGKSYDVRNAADMKALKADYERLGKNTIAVEEGQKNIPRHQTGVRYDPYGASQRPRMGATQAEVDAFNAARAREALSRQIGQSQTNMYNVQQYGLE